MREHNDALRLKDQRSKLGSSTHLVVDCEPNIVHEARKRRVTQVEEESSKPPIIAQESKLVKMINVQGREKAKTRVARAIYASGIAFNVVWYLYWKGLVRVINIACQGFKGPNYEKF